MPNRELFQNSIKIELFETILKHQGYQCRSLVQGRHCPLMLFPIVNGPKFPDYFDRLSGFHFRLTVDVLGSAAADPDFSQIMGFSSTGIFASAHS